MRKTRKNILITMIFIIATILILIINLNSDSKLITRKYIGESDLWSIKLTYTGDYIFETDDDGQLTSSGDTNHDIILIYKGLASDLLDFKEVSVSSRFGGSGISSDGGLTQGDLRFRGGNNGPTILYLENLNDFQITIYWEDDEYHEESIWVNSSN